MSLRCPSDPTFSFTPTEAEFSNPKGEEDDALLATGAWDDQEADDEEESTPRKRPQIHIHTHTKE